MLSIEASFEALGGLQEPLDELLKQRKVLFLKEAPLSALLRALESDPSPALLESFIRRLDALGDDSCGHFEDPFRCFELLQQVQRVPSSFLNSLSHWTRRKLRARPELITARRLCALDDAVAQRGFLSREKLDESIRLFIAFRHEHLRKKRDRDLYGGRRACSSLVPCPAGSTWRTLLKFGLLVLFIMGACHVGRNFSAGGKKSNFEFRAPETRLSFSSLTSSVLMLAAGLCGCLGRLMAGRSHEYEKLKGEDFDLDGVRESLNDFLEDEEDGHHPAPYTSHALDKSEEARVVTGAAASAARDQAVPRLAPPGTGTVHFDMASTDEDLL
eukprot:symbB.v1.2.025179.t1/scaffold2432.1/size79237/6